MILLVLEDGKIINLMKSKILQIAGDASFRKFYRITLKKKSEIIVIAQKEKYKNLIAYSSINKFLKKNRIYAPELYAHNFFKGLIVIEDFGNTSFYNELNKKKINYKFTKDL